MLTARNNSYQTVHAKRQQFDKQSSQSQEPANLQPDRLLTDRSTYIAYLESQLERVTGACLTVQSFDQRIEAVAHAARSLEEKVLNTGRLLKCSQAYSEENESVQKQAVAELTCRVQQLESAATSAESHQLHWEAAQEHALQGRLDALEQRMLSKMDRALAQFLEQQLGLTSQSKPVALPEMEQQLSQVTESVSLLLSGKPTPTDVQRADACLQSVEGMRGVFQQEMQSLKAERSQLREALHDVKWAASQAAGPHQAAAQEMLGGLQRRVDREVTKGMDTLTQAEAELQRLAQQLQLHSRSGTAQAPDADAASLHQQQPSGGRSQASSRVDARQQQAGSRLDAKQQQAGSEQGTQAPAAQSFGGFKTSDLRRAADGAEHSMQQQAQGVQHCMQGLHNTFKDISASLQSLQASLRDQIPAAHAQTKGDECLSPRRAGADAERSLRRSASSLSPVKQRGESQPAKRQWLPGGSFKGKAPGTPTKPISNKPKAPKAAADAAGEPLLNRAIKRRQRLQRLYAELQSLQN